MNNLQETVWCHLSQKYSLLCLSLSIGILSVGLVSFSAFSSEKPIEQGVQFYFKQQFFSLNHPLKREKRPYRRNRASLTNAQLDTMSNWYSHSGKYVEIIRQDDPLNPRYGIALGFEFNENQATYPYFPAIAKVQFKDFSWGGVEFSQRDTCNYTGVSDAVSDDLTVWVDGFKNDTIFGYFHGLLLNGAGTMAAVDSGMFRVLVYRVE